MTPMQPHASKKQTKSTPDNRNGLDAPHAHYTFPPGSPIKYEFTDHLRSLTCKILGQPRPQYRNFATTTKTTAKVKLFSPSVGNQNSFKTAFNEALQKAPKGLFRCNGNPVSVTVKFFFPRPKVHFCVRPAAEECPLKSNAPKFVTKAPDVDNCVKLVLDALQGTAYKNDCCVVHVSMSKHYDHTQLVYKAGVDYVGTTLIKVVEIDPTFATQECKCFHCGK